MWKKSRGYSNRYKMIQSLEQVNRDRSHGQSQPFVDESAREFEHEAKYDMNYYMQWFAEFEDVKWVRTGDEFKLD